MKTLSHFLLVLFIACFSSLYSQKLDSLDTQHSFSFHYSYQVPMGIMSQRFFSNSAVGGQYEFISKKKFIFSLNGAFMFRDTIRENNILDGIKTASGYVIDGNGELATIYLFERGFFFSLLVGKVIPISGSKTLSLSMQAGPGFIQHKILLMDGEFQVPQVSKEYIKGYDRLTNGFLLNESILLRYTPYKRSLSFFAGIDALQGFTKSRRSYDFATMQQDTRSRLDVLVGAKIGMTIIFRRSNPDPFYFY